jgi:nucleotide-binding universal stress UspA family protein
MERIVTGVDGSEAAQQALAWAVDEARRRNATIEVVHAWHQAGVTGYNVLGSFEVFEAKAREVLDAAVDGVDTTDVAVERKLVTAGAGRALIEEAKGAAMVVVGSRGRGGFSGLLLGSVSQQVATHAPCPVVIIPSTR